MVEPRSRESIFREYFRAVRLDILNDVRTVARLLEDEPDPRRRPVETDNVHLHAVLLRCRGKGAPAVAESLVLGEPDELLLLDCIEDTEILYPEE